MSSDSHAALHPMLVSPERCRLHSLSFLLLARVFALLLGINIYQVVGSAIEGAPKLGLVRVLAEGTVHVALLTALISMLWFRRTVVATAAGLEVGRGWQRRVIAWSHVVDVRELPWIRLNPPWYPKMWQVDAQHGKSFDFIGVRQAREIMTAFKGRSSS
jgi:hypothetical protein